MSGKSVSLLCVRLVEKQREGLGLSDGGGGGEMAFDFLHG